MIVDSMTYDEIYSALMKDKMHIEHKVYFEVQKLRRKKLTRHTSINLTHPVSKNYWRVKILFLNSSSTISSYCKWNTKKGWRAAMVVSNNCDPNHEAVQIYNSHFFKRYNERFVLNKLGIIEPKKVVDLYFKRNPQSYNTIIDPENVEKPENIVERDDTHLSDLPGNNFYLFSVDGIGVGKINTMNYQIINTFYNSNDCKKELQKAHRGFKFT